MFKTLSKFSLKNKKYSFSKKLAPARPPPPSLSSTLNYRTVTSSNSSTRSSFFFNNNDEEKKNLESYLGIYFLNGFSYS
jgi:hypothetical protein